MIPYIDAAMNGQTIYSSEIVDTTWGHIFTACYPVVSSDGSGDIIGALCMEMDMEDTYAYLEKSSQSSFKTACVAVAVSILLAGWSYMILRRQPAAGHGISGKAAKGRRGRQRGQPGPNPPSCST